MRVVNAWLRRRRGSGGCLRCGLDLVLPLLPRHRCELRIATLERVVEVPTTAHPTQPELPDARRHTGEGEMLRIALPGIRRRAKRVASRLARRAHRPGELPTRDPVDERDGRLVVGRKPIRLIAVVDIDARNEALFGDAADEGVDQRGVIILARRRPPAAKAALDIGEDRAATEIDVAVPGPHRRVGLLASIARRIRAAVVWSADAPVAMREGGGHKGGGVPVEARGVVFGGAKLANVVLQGHSRDAPALR